MGRWFCEMFLKAEKRCQVLPIPLITDWFKRSTKDRRATMDRQCLTQKVEWHKNDSTLLTRV